MRMLKSIAVLVFVFVVGADAQPGDHFVVLPQHAAKGIVPNQGYWKPTKAQIATAEADLSQISGLRDKGWGSVVHIDHPERYFRQYLPIIRSGMKILYVNAFCDNELFATWRTQLVVVSDGATCFWQALYDPATQTYSHLQINGRG